MIEWFVRACDKNAVTVGMVPSGPFASREMAEMTASNLAGMEGIVAVVIYWQRRDDNRD